MNQYINNTLSVKSTTALFRITSRVGDIEILLIYDTSSYINDSSIDEDASFSAKGM